MVVKKKVLSKSSKASKLKEEKVKVMKPLNDEEKAEKLASVLAKIAGLGQSNLSEGNLREALGNISVEQDQVLEHHLARVNRQLLSKEVCNAIVQSVLR